MPSNSQHTVFVVEDDNSARMLIEELLDGHAGKILSFANAEAFLDACDPALSACVLLDYKMPGLSGLDVQLELARRGVNWPIIFMSGYGDVPTTVAAMKGGAVDFLQKPFKREQLLAAVDEALAKCEKLRDTKAQSSEIRGRYDLLTKREKQVLEAVASGLTNKAVGIRFDISEKTIKVHRGRVMEKMQAGSLAELVLMAQQLGLCSTQIVRTASMPLRSSGAQPNRPTIV